MSYEIPRTEQIPQTDAKVLPFVVKNENGDRINITGATIEYELRKGAVYDPELSLSDTGVSVVNRVDGQGEFAIRLDTDATEGLKAQTYRERVRITDASGDQTTWIGRVPIVEDS